MEETSALLSSLVQTRSIERVLAPIATQVRSQFVRWRNRVCWFGLFLVGHCTYPAVSA